MSFAPLIPRSTPTKESQILERILILWIRLYVNPIHQRRLINPRNLERKVRNRQQQQDNKRYHDRLVLVPRRPDCESRKDNGDGDRDDGYRELGVVGFELEDEELDGEGDGEEEVEFDEHEEDLVPLEHV